MMMTTQEIAQRLIAYCKKGQWEAAQRDLYAQHAVSKEPYATPDFSQVTTGLDAIIEKGKKFDAAVEKIFSIEISEPLITESAIAFKLTMNMIMKGKERMKLPEICVYQVKDGKIISEEFYM